MKYCITGAAGNISRLIVQHLLKANHKVRIVGRNENHLKHLMAQGAEAAIGSVEDVSFLKKSFEGVDAVYTMCPPNLTQEGFVAYAEKIGRNYAEAIQHNKIRYVVNLSSVGAHLSESAGHITGTNKIEEALNGLQNVSIRHLRPTYFFVNLYQQMDMIRTLGAMGANFSFNEKKFPLAHPKDIASIAAERLQRLNFSVSSFEYIASDEQSTTSIAETLGKAIGKPQLQWIKFTDEEMLNAFLQMGVPSKSAGDLVEGFHAIDTGKVLEDYWCNRPPLGSVKLEDFAGQFASAYAALPHYEATGQ